MTDYDVSRFAVRKPVIDASRTRETLKVRWESSYTSLHLLLLKRTECTFGLRGEKRDEIKCRKCDSKREQTSRMKR